MRAPAIAMTAMSDKPGAATVGQFPPQDAGRNEGRRHPRPSTVDPSATRIVCDVTTLLAARGPAHGITRLMGETVGRLVERVPRVSLCAYDQGRRRFRSLPGDPSEVVASMAASSDEAKLAIEAPRPDLTPIHDPHPGAITRMYFALPGDMRIAARRSIVNAARAMSDAGGVLRAAGAAALPKRGRAARSRARLGSDIEFAAGDILLQGGALWGSHGIAAELRRLTSGGARLVSLVYDMIPILRPEFFDPKLAGRFLGWALATLEASEHIVAISDTTGKDLAAVADHYRVTCPSLSVLRLGDDGPGRAPETVDPAVAAIADRPFVLCLGTLEIRKNHRLLHQVWRRLAQDEDTPRLVIVGQQGWLAEETEALLRRDRAVAENVVLVRGARDHHVAWLLSRALFSVYPSLYEGWGLPVAESLAAGRIVVASDASAVREAGQGLALHLPPDDVPQWTELVRSLSRDAALRRRLEGDIAARMRVHTWAQAADEFAERLDELRRSPHGQRID